MFWIFWVSVVVIAYGYFGFPVLLAIRAWLCPKPISAAKLTPRIDILIAAHNEEDCIARKLDSVFATDYPAEQIHVVVASDGSTDDTDSIVSNYDDKRVTLVRVERAGKAAALNAGLEKCRGEVLVFTDANSLFARNSILQLVAPLADSSVGAVAGDQRYQSGSNHSLSGAGERGYWNYDRVLKRLESLGGNAISATGAIYAIRRTLVERVPVGVTDDFAISTGAIAKGYRLVFSESAVAFETVAKSSRVEFGRKVRVMTRGFRSIYLRRSLLNPLRYGFYAVQLFSHKLLRRLMVFPLLALLVSSICLWDSGPFFQLAAVSQVAFYTLACLPFVFGTFGRWKPLALPYFFCLANLAALLAFWKCITSSPISMWDPQREVSPES